MVRTHCDQETATAANGPAVDCEISQGLKENLPIFWRSRVSS